MEVAVYTRLDRQLWDLFNGIPQQPIHLTYMFVNSTQPAIAGATTAGVVQCALGGCYIHPDHTTTWQAPPLLPTHHALRTTQPSIHVAIARLVPDASAIVTMAAETTLGHIGKKYIAGQLQPLYDPDTGKLTISPALTPDEVVQWLEHKIGDELGIWIPIICPLRNPNGGYIGGDALYTPFPQEPQYQSHTANIADVLEPLALDESIYERITVKPIADTYTIDINAEAAKAAAELDTDRDTAHTYGISTDDASVDLRGRAVLIDTKQRVIESHTCGNLMYTTVVPPSKCFWPAALPVHAVTVDLAPAFAGITATWLDRGAISALTTAANWVGGSRSNEIEPQTRTALRTAANTKIELTRLYVRLWALYTAAAQAEYTRRAYTPEVVGRQSHVNCAVSGYHDWASMLSMTTNHLQHTIYFDSHAMTATEDILQVLILATAPKLRNAGLANWLWPIVERLVLATNIETWTPTAATISPFAIVNCIDWLVASTNTSCQSNHAKGLTQALAYRPGSYGIHAHLSVEQSTNIPLPLMATAGQMISPLTLWATTYDPQSSDTTRHDDYHTYLQDTAIASMNYLYSISRATGMLATPRWWPAAAKKLYQRRNALLGSMISQNWYPGVLAATIRRQHAIRIASHHLLAVRPSKIATTRAMARSKFISALSILPWARQPALNDPAALQFIKIAINREGRSIAKATHAH